MAVPARPQNLTVKRTDGEVHLAWSPPEADKGRMPVTGYQVHRGTDPDWLYDTFDVGLNTTFVDTDVRVGKTYYYAVGARSELGSGNVTEVLNVTIEEEAAEGSLTTLMVVMLPLVCMVAALAVWYRRQ
jgi:fibronectin type 3 domain-containing protein